VKLVSLDPKRRRDRRVSCDRPGLVRVERHEDFLIDEQARPGDERPHPFAEPVCRTRDPALGYWRGGEVHAAACHMLDPRSGHSRSHDA
jgi:hypothetical protein